MTPRLIPHTAAMEKGTEMIADTPIFVFVFSTIPNARIMMPARYKMCIRDSHQLDPVGDLVGPVLKRL